MSFLIIKFLFLQCILKRVLKTTEQLMVGEQMVILHKEETELFDRPLFPGEPGDQRERLMSPEMVA